MPTRFAIGLLLLLTVVGPAADPATLRVLTYNVHHGEGTDKKIDLPAAEMAALIGRAQMFASMVHHAVVRIDLPKLLPHGNVTLTPRERECLKWSADGKTVIAIHPKDPRNLLAQPLDGSAPTQLTRFRCGSLRPGNIVETSLVSPPHVAL